jgi:subtilisin family serine protease
MLTEVTHHREEADVNRRTAIGLVFVAVLLSSLPSIMGVAQDESSTSASAKVEARLADLLATEGQGDFIVTMAEQADLSQAYQIRDWSARGRYVYDTLTKVAKRSQSRAGAKVQARGLKGRSFIAGNQIYVRGGDLPLAQALARLPEVASIRAPKTYHIDEVDDGLGLAQSTTQATVDWGIQDTKADQFWSTFGTQGAGIKVASIDTGVDWDHAALVNQFACPGDPTDPDCWYDPSDICGASGACDNNGHGTHTMGTMVALDDPDLTYIAGMAPDATWIACKGCEGNECSDFALNACADWILAPGGDPDNRPNVVNNSWGGDGCDPWFLAKVQAWRAAGIFPAFSAGNYNTCDSAGSPGDYQDSFATTSHNFLRNISSFSSKGPSCFGDDPYTKPNISAPGSSICSTMPGGLWSCGYSGTSMASPHSAGAVALLWSCNPSLIGQIDRTFQILQDTADAPPAGSCGAPADGEGNYTFGYGYLDILAAGEQWCDGTGALDGYVREANLLNSPGDPLPGITVEATREGGGKAREVTDATGYYTMTLPAGTYTVTAQGDLYSPQTIDGIAIVTDTVYQQDFYLARKAELQGEVLDADSGAPLKAIVAVEDGPSVATDPLTGAYGMLLDAGTYTVTASAADHGPGTAVVQVTAGQTTTQDFALQWTGPSLSVTPLSFDVELAPDSVTTRSLTIDNDGSADLTWKIRETVSDTLDGVSLPSAQKGDEPPVLAQPAWSDVPWISEVPSSGVVPAGGYVSVDLQFSSSDLSAGECYTASLGLLHDDPFQETPVMIPVRLYVTPWYTYLPLSSSHAIP